MCGIAGWIGNPADATIRLKVALLMQAVFFPLQTRGKDGAGYVISDADRHHVVKKAVAPGEFISHGYGEALFKHDYNYVLAHARRASNKATTGIDRNCHPYAVKIGEQLYSFGVHNGQVGAIRLVEKYHVRAAEVDSETMFRAVASLQRRGMMTIDAISEVAESVSDISEFACAYLDTGVADPRDRCLYLWRSQGRPLCIIDARALGLGRFFCSTKELFLRAWGVLRGYLGSSAKLDIFEAKPWRLYKVAADGVCEVDAVKEIPHRTNIFKATRKDPDPVWDDAGERRQYHGYRHFERASGYEPNLAEYLTAMTGESPRHSGTEQLSLFKGGVKG